MVRRLPSGRTWKRLVDTQGWFDDAPYLDGKEPNLSYNVSLAAPEAVPGATYGVQSRSIVILRGE